MNYKQCALTQKIEENITKEYKAFIPEKFAKRGKIITIDTKSGNWLVSKVYDPGIEDKIIFNRSNDYLHQRKVSDI